MAHVALVVLAGGLQATFRAFGFAGYAYVAAMQNDPVVGHGQQFLRNIGYKLLLCLQGCFGIGGEPYAG